MLILPDEARILGNRPSHSNLALASCEWIQTQPQRENSMVWVCCAAQLTAINPQQSYYFCNDAPDPRHVLDEANLTQEVGAAYEKENTRLKPLVADLSLDNAIQKEVLSNAIGPDGRRQAVEVEVLIEMWCRHYPMPGRCSAVRPHSSLRYRPPSPSAFIAQPSRFQPVRLIRRLVHNPGARHRRTQCPPRC